MREEERSACSVTISVGCSARSREGGGVRVDMGMTRFVGL